MLYFFKQQFCGTSACIQWIILFIIHLTFLFLSGVAFLLKNILKLILYFSRHSFAYLHRYIVALLLYSKDHSFHNTLCISVLIWCGMFEQEHYYTYGLFVSEKVLNTSQVHWGTLACICLIILFTIKCTFLFLSGMAFLLKNNLTLLFVSATLLFIEWNCEHFLNTFYIPVLIWCGIPVQGDSYTECSREKRSSDLIGLWLYAYF